MVKLVNVGLFGLTSVCKRALPVVYRALGGFEFDGMDLRAIRCARARLVTREDSRGRLELLDAETDSERNLSAVV